MQFDVDSISTETSFAMRRLLVEGLVDSVRIPPDKFSVQVVGPSRILSTTKEMRQRSGMKQVVS